MDLLHLPGGPQETKRALSVRRVFGTLPSPRSGSRWECVVGCEGGARFVVVERRPSGATEGPGTKTGSEGSQIRVVGRSHRWNVVLNLTLR